jgi:hypothetical protein
LRGRRGGGRGRASTRGAAVAQRQGVKGSEERAAAAEELG